MGALATLGQPVFDAEFEADRVELALAYGVTDDLTIAAVVPFGQTCSKVNIELNNANLGLNPFFDQTIAINQNNFPLAPAIPGVVEPLNASGLNTLLTNPAFGFAFDKVGSSSCHDGIGDPTFGLIWNFYKAKNTAATVSANLRWGLAYENRPHDLYDIPVDDGSDDFRLRFDYKHVFGKNWDFTGYLEHNIQTSDHIISRVPSDLSGIVGIDTTEKLKRNLGNYTQLDIDVGRTINDWRVSAGLFIFDKAKDEYTSSLGQNTHFLELNTDSYDKQWHLGLRWMGEKLWKQKKLSSPITIDFKYSQSYDGKNSAHLESAELMLTVPF